MVNLLLTIIYLAFISLGLPDSLLGSAWPTMNAEFGVPLSYAGIISMIIALGTIVSSLQSDRLTRRFGTGAVTAASVAMTAAALFGFSVTRSFPFLCIWAIPYGLGAGSVDASLNNYVALHYKSRHMSWLHCMWGVGAAAGPYLMGYALTSGRGWSAGIPIYRYHPGGSDRDPYFQPPALEKKKRRRFRRKRKSGKALTLRQIAVIPGAGEVMLCFFCYCALEQTAGLWASSYLTVYKGISADTAASFAGLFFIGITVGRAICGFLTVKLNDTQMIRMGQVIIAVGIAAMLIPGPDIASLAGLILIGSDARRSTRA